MHRQMIGFLLRVLPGVLCVSVASPSAFAQGCAMCYSSAAAAGGGAMRALNLGIIVLLVPPLVMFLAVLNLARRRS